MDRNEAEVLIEELCDLLGKQTAMAIRGDFGEVEALMSDAENLTQKITALDAADSVSLTEKKSKLQDMYKKFSLVITDSKDETFAELIKTRKSKAVLSVYKKGAY